MKGDKMKIIMAVRKKPDGTESWDEIGLGFINKDNSVTLIFHYFPTSPNTRILLKDTKNAG